MFDISYYENSSGKSPVEKFIDSLDAKMRAKVFGRMELLEEYGPRLGMPFSRHIDDGIFELRVVQSSDIVRLFYFFVAERTIVLTHGFVKKTKKTPARELEKAKRLRKDWEIRNE